MPRAGGVRDIAACLTALVSISALALAQDGRVFVDCVDPAHPQDTLSIVLDFDRQAVAGVVPINWAWFTGTLVRFQYSALINGHQHTMQSSILDRATQSIEICDFAAGQGQACSRRPCATLPTAVRADR